MADPNLGQTVASSWEAVVGTKPEDNIHADYFFLTKMEKLAAKPLSGGRTINGPIEYAENTTVAAYSDTDPISTTRIDVFDEYQFDWAEYGGTAVISELEKGKNAGQGEKFALLPAKLDSLRNSLRGLINADLLGTKSGKELVGIQDIIATTPTSGTVGGINRGTYSFWRNQYTTAAASSAAFDNLRAAMRSIYNSCSNGISGDHPNVIVTTQTVFQGFEGLLIANERFTEKGVGEGAFETLKFKGAEISFDADCLAAAMYFVNTKYLKLAYKKGRWFRGRPAVQPANQTVDIFLVDTMCQLITSNPRRLGCITSIS